MARRGSGRGGRGPGLNRVSTAALRAELDRRQSEVGELVEYSKRLERELERVRGEIDAFGGVTSGRRRRRVAAGRRSAKAAARGARRGGSRRRPKNDMNLSEALQKLLKGRTMSVTEAASAVQEAGYKTNAANFRVIVNQTLLKSDVFKKVGRGQYTTA